MYKRYWTVKAVSFGFEFPFFFEGTEDALREYLRTELEFCDGYRYHGATEAEIEHWRALGGKIYIV